MRLLLFTFNVYEDPDRRGKDLTATQVSLSILLIPYDYLNVRDKPGSALNEALGRKSRALPQSNKEQLPTPTANISLHMKFWKHSL